MKPGGTERPMDMASDASSLILSVPQPMRSCALTAFRKSPSMPSFRVLPDSSSEDGMEVYVVLRNFQEFAGGFFNRLPEPLRDGVRDSGVCHYMTVFRQQDGTLTQFDFGPAAGGDIHLPGWMLGRMNPKRRLRKGSFKKRVDGKVREDQLPTLPAASMYVGRTNLSLSDIREWNSAHASREYELHKSDCRHFVNSLVQYTTGVERATTSALRHQWAKNKQRYGLASRVIRLGQYFTDVANWERIKAVSHATTAALMALTGHQILAQLRAGVLLRSMQSRLLPATRGTLIPLQVKRALVQKPFYAVGTAAVATTVAASGSQGPNAVRETLTFGARVANGVQTAVTAAAHIAGNLGRGAQRRAVSVATGVATRTASNNARMVYALPKSSSVETGIERDGSSKMKKSSSGSPLRVMFPTLEGKRAQQLALVASRQ